MASQAQLDDLKAKLQAALDAASAFPVDQSASPAPAAGDDLSAKLADLQSKFDALGKERDAYKAAIQTEIDDAKADSDRLEKAIAPVQPIEVPVVTEVVQAPAAPAAAAAAAAPADASASPSPDAAAKSVSAGI